MKFDWEHDTWKITLPIGIAIALLILLWVFGSYAKADDLPIAPNKWYLVQITPFKNFTRVQFMGQFDNEAQCNEILEKAKAIPRISCKTAEMLNALAAEIPAKPGEDI